MEAQIDKFGRVVIPKIVRDHLGLKTGSILTIEERNHDLILTVRDTAPKIKVKGGISVYLGQATDDLDSIIQDERENRLKGLGDS